MSSTGLRYGLLAAVMVGGYCAVQGDDKNSDEFAPVKTRLLEVVDSEGKIRARIEGASVELLGDDGTPFLVASVQENRARITINTTQRKSAIDIGYDDQDLAGIIVTPGTDGRSINIGRDKGVVGNCICIRNGEERVVGLAVTPRGTGAISVVGKLRDKFAVSTMSWGYFGLGNHEGHSVFSASVTDDKSSHVEVNDSRGNTKILFSGQSNEKSGITLFGTESKPSVELKSVGQEGQINLSSVMGKSTVTLQGGAKDTAALIVRDPSTDAERIYGAGAAPK